MSPWIDSLLLCLARQPVCGYRARGAAASEPTALAALALVAHERAEAATAALNWLVERQASDGSVGVRADEPTPCWPTALAVLAWRWAEDSGQKNYVAAIRRGRGWLLSMRGETMARSAEIGHDSTLNGWPWVPGTHSWLEPTAWSVLALAATGEANNPRLRDGRRLIADRLLPDGGCNYGNTVVLGQSLRAQVEPSGLALWALSVQRGGDNRIGATIDWLLGEINGETTAVSLSYALLGLSAHGRAPSEAENWLRAAFENMKPADTAGLKLALVGLAAAACSGRGARFFPGADAP
jgi:hypothetical protein